MLRQIFGGPRPYAFAMLVALVALKVANPAFVDELEVRVYDVYQQIYPRPAPEMAVRVIDIDEASLAELGQWPWSRKVVGDIVLNAAKAGAAGIGFDVVFAEQDNLSPKRFAALAPGIDAATKEALEKLPSTDEYFAEVVKQTRAVLGQAERHESGIAANAPGPAALAVLNGTKESVSRYLLSFENIVGNLPGLEKVAAGRGMFITNPESDGIVRRIPAIVAVGKEVYPTLAIEMLRVAAGASTLLVRQGPAGVEDVVLQGPNYIIPTDGRGRLWPHYSKFNPDRLVSAKDVLHGKPEALEALKGKLVLLGASAAGLRDIRASPVDKGFPGVEVHAQLLESIMTDTLLTQPAWGDGAERLLTAISGIIMIITLAVVGARWSLIVFLFASISLFAGAWYLYVYENLLVDVAFAIVTAFLIYIVVTYLEYIREQKERQKTRSAFSLYLSPAMVERVAANPEALKLGGEMRDMTLMFCDLRGFTTISENYNAGGLTHLINAFLTPMTDIIQATGGCVDKYIGDCIMAFWNAPLDAPLHRRDACRAALLMRARLRTLNEELKQDPEAKLDKHGELKIGIGLNTGEVCVGNMGSQQRLNYSVLGDAVNLASRLEGQSKTYHYDLVIGETTYDGVKDMAALELDLIQVKGKTVPVRIFTLVGDETMAATPDYGELRRHHNIMMAAYRAQDWAGARAALQKCVPIAPRFLLEGLYEVYEERIDHMEKEPPGPEWDGVFVATSK
ncbi:MAG: adenylate/guanylate cyclase domain-containing protein [Proteobacteria bacterium]|nr:adenylate/guanylate cyclase domain-containing protein [Pseudomonadota bacterium]